MSGVLRWRDISAEVGMQQTTHTIDYAEGFRTQFWHQLGWVTGDGTVHALGELSPRQMTSGKVFALWVLAEDSETASITEETV